MLYRKWPSSPSLLFFTAIPVRGPGLGLESGSWNFSPAEVACSGADRTGPCRGPGLSQVPGGGLTWASQLVNGHSPVPRLQGTAARNVRCRGYWEWGAGTLSRRAKAGGTFPGCGWCEASITWPHLARLVPSVAIFLEASLHSPEQRQPESPWPQGDRLL